MDKRVLDLILVPSGLIVMVAYHLWLLHRVVKHPTNTVIGVNAINRRFWVQAMMEDVSKNGVLAVQSLRNNIMASTLLASTAIMLSSLIAVLMTSGNNNDPNQKSIVSHVFGDRSEFGLSIKFFTILVYMLLASILAQCSVHKVLQPCQHSHQRAVQEALREPSTPGANCRVCCSNCEQGKLFLVARIESFLLLLPSLLVDLRTYPNVCFLLCSCFHTILLGCHI